MHALAGACRHLKPVSRSFRTQHARRGLRAFAATAHASANKMAFAPTSGLHYPEVDVVEPLSEHKSSIIMIHGLGDTSLGWMDIGEMLGPNLPDTKWVFPTAPVRPITLNGGMRMTGWYDIHSLDRINAQQDTPAIKESQEYIQHLVEAEVAAGIPSDKVLVGGFSQGGAVALTMLRSPLKLAGVLGLSCYLLMHHDRPLVSEANKTTPVLMCHGDSDAVVGYEFGKESAELLQAEGALLEFKTYKWMGHEARPDELQDMLAFLKKCLYD